MTDHDTIDASTFKRVLKRLAEQYYMLNAAVHVHDDGKKASAWTVLGSEQHKTDELLEDMEEMDDVGPIIEDINDEIREEAEELENTSLSYTG